MNIQKLKQDRADAFGRMTALHALAATQKDGIMTAEQISAYNVDKSLVSGLDANIAIAQEQLDAQRHAPAAATMVKDEADKKKFNTLGEQLVAIVQYSKTKGHVRDPRLFASPTGQNETIDAEGGFLVQEDFAPDLLTRTFEDDEILQRCDTVPVGSSRLVMNGVVDDNRVGGPAGMGVLVYRVAEAQLFNFSAIKFRRVELNMNKLIGGFKATDELLEDAPALQSQVNKLFPPAFSWRMANEVLNGTGAGQFLGINTSGVTVITPKEANQVAGTITTNNVLAMKTRLWARSRKNAVWVTGPDVEAVLETLTIPGPQGTAVALYTQPGMNGNKYGMMLGIPVIVVEQTAMLGTQGDIMLCDFSQYVVGERNGNDPKFATSIHVAFMTDEQVFRWTLRNDGQPYWDKPVTQNNSANKVSPFVVLATRS